MTLRQRCLVNDAVIHLISGGHIGAAFALCSPLMTMNDMATVILACMEDVPELGDVFEALA